MLLNYPASREDLLQQSCHWTYMVFMTEGRRSQVVLLDERRLDILIQPKLYAGDLLGMVASHFSIKEKEYFGLAYQDDTGHYNWLQLDRRVLEHEFPKLSQGPLTLYFLVKYFVEHISQLRDTSTVEAFFLQAKSLVYRGTIEVESETVFRLAALVLQSSYGDFVDDCTAKGFLKKLPLIPTSTLKEHPSLTVCEGGVIENYKKLKGLSRGSAIVEYMRIVQAVPTYGIHFYQVKDKGGIPWWLGLSHRGISQYDFSDRKTPRRVFLWKQLENLYFRDRKFSIEVHEAKRVVHSLSSFNLYEDAIEEPLLETDDLSVAICDPTTQVSVSRRTFGPGNVTVYIWLASTPGLTKCIWSMAIAQHQFYLDRKHNKAHSGLSRTLGQIATELSKSTQSLSSSDSNPGTLSRSASTRSLPLCTMEVEESEETKAARLAMLEALRIKRDALHQALLRKTAELKALCLEEGKLTGELPVEMPLGPGEKPPSVRRRVGTSFALSDKLVSSNLMSRPKEEEALSRLELDFETQSKIAAAALSLANDASAKKNVRRQRKLCYQQAHAKLAETLYQKSTVTLQLFKLKEIEKKLILMRKQAELKRQQIRQASDEEPSEDNMSHTTDGSGSQEKVGSLEESPSVSMHTVELEDTNNHINRVLTSCNMHGSKSPSPAPSSASSSIPDFRGCSTASIGSGGCSASAPASPVKHRHHSVQSQHSVSSSGTPPASPVSRLGPGKGSMRGYQGQGYKPNVVYQTKQTYRTQHYPTLPLNTSFNADYDNVSVGGLLKTPYQNRFESGLNTEGYNLYSVQSQRTSQAFDTQDDIQLSSLKNEPELSLMSRHNSLDSMRRHSHNNNQSPTSPHNSDSPVGVRSRVVKTSVSYNEQLKFASKQEECGSLDRRTASQGVVYNHTILQHHHLYHQTVPSSPNTRRTGPLSSQSEAEEQQDSLEKDCVDGAGCHAKVPFGRTSDSELNLVRCRDTMSGVNYSVMRPSTLPLAPKNPVNRHTSASNRVTYTSSASSKPVSVVHPQLWAQQCLETSSQNKAKPKEWTETSLDSPLPLRKVRSREHSASSANLSMEFEVPIPQLESLLISKPPQSPRAPSPSKHLTPKKAEQSMVIYEQATPTEASPAPEYAFRQNTCEVDVVSVGHFQPYWEETKPYEISDFYKYSTKHRKAKKSESSPGDLSSAACQSPKRVRDVNSDTPGDRMLASPTNKVQTSFDSPGMCLMSSPGAQKLLAHGGRSPRDPSKMKSPFMSSPESNFSFDGCRMSVADDFHDEMLAWYEDQENVKRATLV